MPDIQVTDSTESTTIVVSPTTSTTTIAVTDDTKTTAIQADAAPAPPPDVAVAPAGVQGPTGAQGIPGEQSLYVQATQPTGLTRDYLWVQTGLGPTGDDWTLWFEDNG